MASRKRFVIPNAPVHRINQAKRVAKHMGYSTVASMHRKVFYEFLDKNDPKNKGGESK